MPWSPRVDYALTRLGRTLLNVIGKTGGFSSLSVFTITARVFISDHLA
jgi:DNA-binding HxlR family transcriptional regulator